MLQIFKRNNPKKVLADNLYAEIKAQARHQDFYSQYNVPDTPDGRFDLIVMHAILLMLRIQKMNRGHKINQKLFDTIFVDMEYGLREMGIGDLSVPKHMKRMMKGFNGRRIAYESALENKDDALLEDTVRKNIYGTIEQVDDSTIQAVSKYIKTCWSEIKKMSDDDVMNAHISFAGLE